MINVGVVVVFVAMMLVLNNKRLRLSTSWSAMVTPLASIIGSGFLVSVPLLAGSIGPWAILAVTGLCVIAYFIGGAIRFNIQESESYVFTKRSSGLVDSVEGLSHLVLIGAYFISVAYYLALLSVFSLKLIGIDDSFLANCLSSSLIILICGLGATKGLSAVEKAEKVTVSVNLSAIAALIMALLIFGFNLPSSYAWSSAFEQPHELDWDTVRFLMGLLIIVQGFETTRFMGDLYNGDDRVSAMKNAQRASFAIYLVFFILMLPLFTEFTGTADVAGFIDVIGQVSPWLPFVVTAGAIASQFSASVADSIGSSGLVANITRGKVDSKHAYILIGAVSLMVIWSSDVVSIVTLASRAFALFYSMQCLVAFLVAKKQKKHLRSIWYLLLSSLALIVTLLGIPAGA